MFSNRRRLVVILFGVFLLAGCGLPAAATDISPATSPTIYLQTLAALQTKAVMTATAQGIPGAPTLMPIPASGGTPGLPPVNGTPGTQNAVALNDTLCWRGPGPRYETISAVFKGTRIQLIGRGILPGWYIIIDPLFLDPCWIQATDIQPDPTVNLSALPVYGVPLPPPLPTLVVTRSPVAPPSLAPTATPVPPTLPPPPPASATPPPLASATPVPPSSTPAPVPTATSAAPTLPPASPTP